MAAGTRLTLKSLVGGVNNYVSCLGKSACIPSWLDGLAGGVTNHISCLGRVPALFPSWGLALPVWE